MSVEETAYARNQRVRRWTRDLLAGELERLLIADILEPLNDQERRIAEDEIARQVARLRRYGEAWGRL